MDNNNWFDGAKFIIETLDQPVFPLLSFMSKGEAITIPTKGGFKEGANAEEWLKNNDVPVPPFPSKNLDIVKQWAENPSYPAYGIPAYKKFVMVDIDIKNGLSGEEAIQWLHDNGIPDNSLRVDTPTGGWHEYFYAPTTYKVKQAVNITVNSKEFMELFGHNTSIDIRHGNGYVVGPGSVKRKSDGSWSDKYKVTDRSKLPGILPDQPRLSEISTVKEAPPFKQITKSPTDWFYSTDLIEEGNRDNFATKFTYFLATKDLSQSEVVLHLSNLATRVAGGVTAEKIQSLYKSALDKIGIDPADTVKTMVNRYFETFIGTDLLFFDSKYRRLMKPSALSIAAKTRSFSLETDKGPKRINPFDEFLFRKDMQKLGGVQYTPVEESIYTNESGYTTGNLCHMWDRKLSIDPSIDVSEYTESWIKVFNHVLGNDAVPLMRWVVAAFFHPLTRPNWYVYLLSDHKGIGKDLIFSLIRSLFIAPNGKKNAAVISMDDLIDGFNVTIFDHVLLTMSDQSKIDGRSKISKALERFITDEEGLRQPKNIDKTSVTLFSRLMISNNESDFIEIPIGDRRAFISRCQKKPIEDINITNGIYAKAAACSFINSGLDGEQQYQCRVHILNYFIANMNMLIQETKYYVTGHAPITMSKEDVQNESSALRFQKVRSSIKEGLEGEYPTYRGASIFHSSVITEAALKGFLEQELEPRSRGDATKFARDLEKEGIISRIRMSPRSNGKQDKASMSARKEEYYVDKDSGQLMCRYISTKRSTIICYIVNALWRGRKTPTTTELRQEYLHLFIYTDSHEPIIYHSDIADFSNEFLKIKALDARKELSIKTHITL